MKKRRPFFIRFSHKVAAWCGSSYAFLLALLIILVWLITGPIFEFSDTWQLIINTATTIVTFLMVFIIQNTQNRDTIAIQLKLDELIRATEGAHIVLLDLEELSEEELAVIRSRYLKLAQEARRTLRRGGIDTDMPEVDCNLVSELKK